MDFTVNDDVHGMLRTVTCLFVDTTSLPTCAQTYMRIDVVKARQFPSGQRNLPSVANLQHLWPDFCDSCPSAFSMGRLGIISFALTLPKLGTNDFVRRGLGRCEQKGLFGAPSTAAAARNALNLGWTC